jgi:hypothetical protein
MNETDPDSLTKEEEEKLRLDRKRFLHSTYIATGIPPYPSFGARGQSSVTETTITSEIAQQTSVAAFRGIGSHSEVRVTNNRCGTYLLTFAQQCCPGNGEGCKVNHGATRYATTVGRRNGKFELLPLIEDTGTNINWIPLSLVHRLQCDIRDADRRDVYFDFRGESYEVKKEVTITLTGNAQKSRETIFFVAPDGLPLECAILGREFIEEAGHPHTLFPDRPDAALLMVQKQVTVSVGAWIE